MSRALREVDLTTLWQHHRAVVLLDPYLNEQLLRRGHVDRQVQGQRPHRERFVVFVYRFQILLVIGNLSWCELFLDVLRHRLATLPCEPMKAISPRIPKNNLIQRYLHIGKAASDIPVHVLVSDQDTGSLALIILVDPLIPIELVRPEDDGYPIISLILRNSLWIS